MSNKNIRLSETDLYLCITPLQSFTDDLLDDFKGFVSRWCDNKDKHIIIDLENVALLTSRAITHLISLYKVQQSKNKLIALVNLSKEMEDLLISTNITKVIPIFETIEDFLISLDDSDIQITALSPAKVKIETKEDIVIIQLEPEGTGIDISMTDFTNIFSKINSNKVIVDLNTIINLDEKAISSFSEFADKIEESQGRLVLSGVNTITKDLFYILGIEDKFDFTENVEEGIGILKKLEKE